MQASIPPPQNAQAGFNLVELMVVVAVVAVLLAVGLPSFQFVANSGKVTNPANELLSSLQMARMEALRRGQRTVVCRSDDADAVAPACNAANGNWNGWLVFVDLDRDGVLDAGEAVLRATSVEAPAVVVASAAVSGASSRVQFRPDGFARAANGALLTAQIRICVPTTTPAQNARDVAITSGSRFAVARVDAAGACAAPADS